MDKYEKIEQPREEPEIKDNEIRITTKGKMRNSISYATTLFKEKGFTEVVLKAMGRAINKTVTIAEIIKRRIPSLHQITEISSTDITDVYEPLEEGLDRIETTRHVSSITVTLSTAPLDSSLPGYQAPLPEEQVKEQAASPAPTGEAPPKARWIHVYQGCAGQRLLAVEAGEAGEVIRVLVMSLKAPPPHRTRTCLRIREPNSQVAVPSEARVVAVAVADGGSFNQGGNGFPVQAYPQQGLVGGYPGQAQVGTFAAGINGGAPVRNGRGGYRGGRGGRRGGAPVGGMDHAAVADGASAPRPNRGRGTRRGRGAARPAGETSQGSPVAQQQGSAPQ